jgi:hypothetical protein
MGHIAEPEDYNRFPVLGCVTIYDNMPFERGGVKMVKLEGGGDVYRV